MRHLNRKPTTHLDFSPQQFSTNYFCWTSGCIAKSFQIFQHWKKTSCEVAHEHWGIQHNALWYFHKSFFFAQSASMKSFLIMCNPSSVPGCWPFSTHKCPFGIKNAAGMVLLLTFPNQTNWAKIQAVEHGKANS